jgi:hypothetical protein
MEPLLKTINIDVNSLPIEPSALQVFSKALFSIWATSKEEGWADELCGKDFDERIEYISCHKLNSWVSVRTYDGKLVRTKAFCDAWPFLKQFWSQTDVAIVCPLVDAIVTDTTTSNTYYEFNHSI